MEVAEEDLELVNGEVRVKGVPERAIKLGELAVKANPLRGAVKPGTTPGLEATNYFGPARGATASGVHAMIVEVDPETLGVEIKKYVVVHDCGTVINPLILEGQVQGGVAQGLGNAFYEQLVYDENGQLTHRHLHGLPGAHGHGSAARHHRPHGHALAAEPHGHQGRGRGRRHPGRTRCSRRRWKMPWPIPAWRSSKSR